MGETNPYGVKICFVQPSNEQTTSEHKHALALTFPYLLRSLAHRPSLSFSLYVEGRSPGSFREHLDREEPDAVFITANTTTFPNAVELARLAKAKRCKVYLGGPFATLCSNTIAEHCPDFDVIVEGGMPDDLLERSIGRRVVSGPRSIDLTQPLSTALSSGIFAPYYADPVCYDLGFGCTYACSFCTMRRLWQKGVHSRTPECVREDLRYLVKWPRLKIIDDDVLLSARVLEEVRLPVSFRKVIAETRPDRIGAKSLELLKRFGVTHLLMGVESFAHDHIRQSNKSHQEGWHRQVLDAVQQCAECGIVARPILQMLFPGMTRGYLESIRPILESWSARPDVEVFFVFFAPHPGLGPVARNRLITNDLRRFDHFNPVYMPDDFDLRSVGCFIEAYNRLLDELRLGAYNQPVLELGRMIPCYDPFFS